MLLCQSLDAELPGLEAGSTRKYTEWARFFDVAIDANDFAVRTRREMETAFGT